MQTDDTRFFEEYKRLEKLCSDLYSCNNGVSEYIADMGQKAMQGEQFVSTWTSDYRMLKHVRWVRNRIAHDTAMASFSEAADLAFVQSFYQRILKGQDPLALLHAAELSRTNRNEQPRSTSWQADKPVARVYEVQPAPMMFRRKKRMRVLILFLPLLIILFLIFFFLSAIFFLT